MKYVVQATITALITTLALLFAGCGGETYELEPTSTAPSVAGNLKVEEYNESNYTAELELQYLPLPKNLGEGLSTYVVWVNPQNTDTYIKAGNLRVGQDSRDGELEFTTPYSAFNVIVTAEQNPRATEPGEPIVLEQQVVMR